MTRLVHRSAPVLENVRLARDTYRIRLAVPELAQAIVPGQFVMLRLPDTTDPLLGRAFALYDTRRGLIVARDSGDERMLSITEAGDAWLQRFERGWAHGEGEGEGEGRRS